MQPAHAIREVPGVSLRMDLPSGLLPRQSEAIMHVEFGLASSKASCRVTAAGHADELIVSAELGRQLGIPTPGVYRVRRVQDRLLIGPTVGILAGRGPEEMSPRRLELMRNHFLVQAPRGGMFIAFDRQSVMPAQRLVSGFRLDADGVWQAGRWPIPRVIFRRYGIEFGPLLPELKSLGVLVFNERTLNKWEAWEWLSQSDELRPHLPETRELVDVASVLAMLAKYPTVFLKPSWGSLGKRILKVARSARGFVVDTSDAERIDCPDAEALSLALGNRLPRPGIVQQGLDLTVVGDRLVDFRTVTQKDGSGDWTVTGIVGRCGKSTSMVSNVAAGGFPVPVDYAMSLVFGASPAAHVRRRAEITRLAESAGAALDRSGLLLGDLGLDVAYDKNYHPWLIEANNRDPDQNLAWKSGSRPAFYRLRSAPIDYACYLAGFPLCERGEQ